jgi:DNA primase
MVTELAVEPLFCSGEPDARYAVEQLARVQERLVVARIEELRSRLQRVDPGDAEAGSALFAELVTLEQRRRELRDSAFGPA